MNKASEFISFNNAHKFVKEYFYKHYEISCEKGRHPIIYSIYLFASIFFYMFEFTQMQGLDFQDNSNNSIIFLLSYTFPCFLVAFECLIEQVIYKDKLKELYKNQVVENFYANKYSLVSIIGIILSAVSITIFAFGVLLIPEIMVFGAFWVAIVDSILVCHEVLIGIYDMQLK